MSYRIVNENGQSTVLGAVNKGRATRRPQVDFKKNNIHITSNMPTIKDITRSIKSDSFKILSVIMTQFMD